MSKRKTSLYIPRQCEILGHTLYTVINDELCDEQNAVGCSVFPRNVIYLRHPSSLYCLELIESTYFHEKKHYEFYFSGENELNANEKLVDLLGNMEYQFLKTSGFRLPPKDRIRF